MTLYQYVLLGCVDFLAFLVLYGWAETSLIGVLIFVPTVCALVGVNVYAVDRLRHK